MNFNLVEGEESRLSDDNYDDFKWDYLHSELSTVEVREKWGLSKREYSKITKEIRKELGLTHRPFTRAKYFYKAGNQWQIIKTNKGKRTVYGSFCSNCYSEDDMKEIVEKLKELDWEYTLCRQYLARFERCRI